MTVEQILEDVKTWTPAELQELRVALGEALSNQAEPVAAQPLSEAETLHRQNLLEQRLRAAGLLEAPAEETPLPEHLPENGAAVETEEFQLVTVAGEPVSETIIRERR